MNEQWVIVCLGNAPWAFGPFATEDEADDWVKVHCTNVGNHPDTNFCLNGIEWDEHHVIRMVK